MRWTLQAHETRVEKRTCDDRLSAGERLGDDPREIAWISSSVTMRDRPARTRVVVALAGDLEIAEPRADHIDHQPERLAQQSAEIILQPESQKSQVEIPLAPDSLVVGGGCLFHAASIPSPSVRMQRCPIAAECRFSRPPRHTPAGSHVALP
jgi:hypothetical protein